MCPAQILCMSVMHWSQIWCVWHPFSVPDAHLCVIINTGFLIRVVSHQGWSFIRMMSWGWSLIRMFIYQGGLSSGWSLIRMFIYQGGLSSEWSLIRTCIYQGGLSSEWSLIRMFIYQGGLHHGGLWSMVPLHTAYLLHTRHIIKSSAVCSVEVEVIGFAVEELVPGSFCKPGWQLPHAPEVGWNSLQRLGGCVCVKNTGSNY